MAYSAKFAEERIGPGIRKFGQLITKKYRQLAQPHIGLAIGKSNFTQLLKEFLEKELSSDSVSEEKKESIRNFLKVYPEFAFRNQQGFERQKALPRDEYPLLPHQANQQNPSNIALNETNEGVFRTNTQDPLQQTGGSKKRKQVHKKKSKKTKKHF